MTVKQEKYLVWISIILGVLMILGETVIAPACPVKQDGSWMKCHWASQAKLGLGIMVLLTAALEIVLSMTRKKERGGELLVSNLFYGLLAILLQSVLIGGCKMKDMRCHTHNFPFSYFIAGLLLVIGAISLVFVLRSRRKA